MFEYIFSLSWTFWSSFVISICTALYFINKQSGFYKSTLHNLSLFLKFFHKKGEYDIYHESSNDSEYDEDGNTKKNNARIKNIAEDDAALHVLIDDINEYLGSCKGTATFEIIQNKTERRISKMYDNAVSKSSFPTHYGLMGTFVGVFIGLGLFLLGSILQGGITDDSIHSLILGVLVSMSTSFIGLRMSTKANDLISNAKTKIDDDKNEFYEFVQNKLMTSVNVSLTEALSSLHETVTTFEPSFSKVIAGFQTTFQQCTKAFGNDFRTSVREMVSAVTTMSNNIDAITSNVTLLERLLNRLSGSEWTSYMRQFADANEHFKTLTQSLDDFERARRMMLAAAQEAINIQKSYNDSLEMPRQVAENINSIMQRVVRFEESINALGVNIAQTQMFGNAQIEEIQQQITAIKKKHKVAEQYIETANNKLEMFFDSQLVELKRLETKYLKALENLFNAYEMITDDHKDEINQRHEIFKNAIEDKFEMAGVRAELANLKKIPEVEKKVDEVKRGQQQLMNTNEGIRKEINAFNVAQEDKEKGVFGGMFGGANSAKDREIKRQEEENDRLKKLLEEAQREREEQRKFEEMMNGMTESESTKPVQPSVITPKPEPVIEQEKQENEVKKRSFWGRILGGK